MGTPGSNILNKYLLRPTTCQALDEGCWNETIFELIVPLGDTTVDPSGEHAGCQGSTEKFPVTEEENPKSKG